MGQVLGLGRVLLQHNILQLHQSEPFKDVYREPPSIIKYNSGDTIVDILEEALRANLCQISTTYEGVDRKRREVNFEEGEMVYLKLQPYRQRSLARRPLGNLAPKILWTSLSTQEGEQSCLQTSATHRLQASPDVLCLST